MNYDFRTSAETINTTHKIFDVSKSFIQQMGDVLIVKV